MTIVIATGNRHKVDELTTLFYACGLTNLTLVPITDVITDYAPEETGTTFEENAYIKAEEAYRRTGLPAIADDSGLEVPSLLGAPGIKSARYAGNSATDADNRKKLQTELASVGNSDWYPAVFRCVLCYHDGMRYVFGEGQCNGRIWKDERGMNGFGYDSMFSPEDHKRRFAEMTQSDKAQFSHRARAVAEIAGKLRVFLGEDEPIEHPDKRSSVAGNQDLAVEISVLAASRQYPQLTQVLHGRIHTQRDAVEAYELLLQLYLFVGFPIAIEALLILWNAVQSNIPGFQWPLVTRHPSSYRKHGTQLFHTIYGSVADKVLERFENVAPDLADWMVTEGYGKVLSRPELPIQLRELCIASVLAVQKNDRQLVSHVRGCARVGVSREQLFNAARVVARTDSSAGERITQLADQFCT